MARTLPTLVSPIDMYMANADRPLAYFECTDIDSEVCAIFSKATINAGYNDLGCAGYFETHIAGTLGGTLYGIGSWINFDTACVPGANMICAQDNGIYSPSTITVSSAKLVIGMRMELVIEGGADPASLFLFSTNIYDNALTAFFDINAKVDAGWITGALSNASGAGHVPLFLEASTGTVHYVNTYTQ